MMGLRRNFTVCLILLWSSQALAQPGGFGIDIPAGGGPMPNYWSGTNCRASGGAQIGDPIYQAQLLLNGQEVAFWHAPEGSELPLSMALAAMFDSSHFPNSAPVEVTYRVWGLLTGMHEESSAVDPVVKNYAMFFEHEDVSPDAIGYAYASLAWKNYGMLSFDGGAWGEAEFLGALDVSNVVFYSGHGNEYVIQTMWWNSTSDFFYVHWNEIEEARVSQIGSGIPPYNTGSPPVNFSHLVACTCGFTPSFNRFCYPYYMAWGGPWMEDQAVMAYGCFVYLEDEAKITDLIWSKLGAGWSARGAHDEFNDWIELNPGVIEASDTFGGDRRPMVPGDQKLYSGPDMGAARIKSVYTGANYPPAFPAPWYRTI